MEWARDGQGALARMVEIRQNMVLLDLNLPGISDKEKSLVFERFHRLPDTKGGANGLSFLDFRKSRPTELPNHKTARA